MIMADNWSALMGLQQKSRVSKSSFRGIRGKKGSLSYTRFNYPCILQFKKPDHGQNHHRIQ